MAAVMAPADAPATWENHMPWAATASSAPP